MSNIDLSFNDLKQNNLPINLGNCIFNNTYSSIFKNDNIIIKTNFKKNFKLPLNKLLIAKKKLSNEIKYLKSLKHINIVEMHHHFIVNDYIFIILEYINGLDLYEHINNGKKFNEKDIQNILKQVFSALSYIHSKSIVHGDIKLENIILNYDNSVKLIDFEFSHNINNTQKKIHFGTEQCVAPELFLSKPYNCKIDVWSLGITILHMCGFWDVFEMKIIYVNIPNNTFKFNYQRLESTRMWKCLSESFQFLIYNMLIVDKNQRSSIDDLITWEFIRN